MFKKNIKAMPTGRQAQNEHYYFCVKGLSILLTFT